MRRYCILIAVAGSICIGACSNNPAAALAGYAPSPDFTGLLAPVQGLDASMQIYVSKLSIAGGTVSAVRADAIFSASDPEVYAGTVSINGTPLWANYTPGSGTWYSSQSPDSGVRSMSIAFGGRELFYISGSARFPGIIDSVPSPSSDLTIRSPRATDTLSKSSDCTIAWNGAGCDRARIIVSDGQRQISAQVDDTGSYTIPSADVSALAPGPLYITVARGNYTLVERSDALRYCMMAGSLHQVQTWLAP